MPHNTNWAHQVLTTGPYSSGAGHTTDAGHATTPILPVGDLAEVSRGRLRVTVAARLDQMERWELTQRLTDIAEALDGLGNLFANDPRDWAANKRDAWAWGVIVGWDDTADDPDNEAMKEVAQKHGWDEPTVERLRRYRASIERVLPEDSDAVSDR